MKKLLIFNLIFICFLSCQENQSQKQEESPKELEIEKETTSEIEIKTIINYDSIFHNLPEDTFVELIKWDSSFVLDIRYATENNFTKTVLYPCGRAFLRKKVALALLQAHQEFKKLGIT